MARDVLTLVMMMMLEKEFHIVLENVLHNDIMSTGSSQRGVAIALSQNLETRLDLLHHTAFAPARDPESRESGNPIVPSFRMHNGTVTLRQLQA